MLEFVTICIFLNSFLWYSFPSYRLHPMRPASCSESGTAAKWRRVNQEEEKEKEEGTARGRWRRRRTEERGKWRRVLRWWGHVHYWPELRWGNGGGQQQVCVQEKVWICLRVWNREGERKRGYYTWYLTGEKNICWLSQCCLRSRWTTANNSLTVLSGKPVCVCVCVLTFFMHGYVFKWLFELSKSWVCIYII